MVDKIRVYNIVSDDYINNKNSIFHGTYYKTRWINHLRYGIRIRIMIIHNL
jgi:hypothetical protein